MKPDYAESLRFLRILYPTGPWMLTAISVDKKQIDARTFSSDESDEVLSWLHLHEKRNLYYSVNQPVIAAYEKKKLSKAEVLSAHFLHVDVDPRVGEDVAAEQERIHEQIMSYKIEPTVVVFSGGGYNAIWRLDEAVPIFAGASSPDEAVARALEFERYNWKLELDFSTPDHCRDVCRILRLPGTINRPNAEKIAKGRVPTLARIAHESGRVYPLSVFSATPAVSTNTSTSKTVSNNVERVESLDNLNIPESLKVIIAQGFDPTDTAKWQGDRSSALYYVCCELVRSGIPDEQILGIITDSRYLISASVLDKGAGIQRYAHRQVQRARDNAEGPYGSRLADMNEQYAVIQNYGSKCVVMKHIRDQNKVGHVFMRPNEFTLGLDNEKIRIVGANGKEKLIGVGSWWFDQPRRRQYSTVVFQPGLDIPGVFNLDTGFKYEPKPGVLHIKYLEHMRENICSGNEEHFSYLLKWMARVVQFPRTQSESAIVLQGERGTGKTLFVENFGKLFGRHWITVSDNRHLTGNFNAHLGHCVFVHADEAWRGRDIRHEGVLKTLITGKRISIEMKGVDVQDRDNYIHLMMSCNDRDAIPAGDHERRFLVLDVSSAKRQDTEYFRAIMTDLEDEGRNTGYSNLLYFLLTEVDLSNFDAEVRNPPKTKALSASQEENFSDTMEWLHHKLISGDWLDGTVPWEGPVDKKLLHNDYIHHMEMMKSRKPLGERAFHNFIMTQLKEAKDKRLQGKQMHHRPMAFLFPTLKRCRELFDEMRGWLYEWPEIPESSAEEREADVIKGVF